jgi:microcystin-dependent protein
MEGTIGQILLFGSNFAPISWALCQGQLLNISSNSALYAIIGVNFGGNGTTNFALPNLMGRVPVGIGNGPGLTPVVLGQAWGNNNYTLSVNNLPPHAHAITASLAVYPDAPNADNAVGNVAAVNDNPSFSTLASNSNMAPGNLVLSTNGNNAPFSLMKPYLGLNFLICTQGVFPIRP